MDAAAVITIAHQATIAATIAICCPQPLVAIPNLIYVELGYYQYIHLV